MEPHRLGLPELAEHVARECGEDPTAALLAITLDPAVVASHFGVECDELACRRVTEISALEPGVREGLATELLTGKRAAPTGLRLRPRDRSSESSAS